LAAGATELKGLWWTPTHNPMDTPGAKKEAQKAAKADWQRRTGEWEAMAKANGIHLKPGETIDPKDVRVEIGPPMTEAEFKAWHERRKNIAKNFSQ